jgi:hypothetical protein
MGKRKPFIDKKHATTYSLIYRPADEAAADPTEGERLLVPVGQLPPQGNSSAPSSSWPSGSSRPLWADGPFEELPESRRREHIELGLPDDGYDYLKHLRSLRPAPAAELDAAAAQQEDTQEAAVAGALPNGTLLLVLVLHGDTRLARWQRMRNQLFGE